MQYTKYKIVQLEQLEHFRIDFFYHSFHIFSYSDYRRKDEMIDEMVDRVFSDAVALLKASNDTEDV